MKQKNLYVLVGCPASGKSTWAEKWAEQTGALHVSRDKVRFGLLQPGDDYFAREDEVFDAFCNTITAALKESNYLNVIADATHLNQFGRRKLLDNIDAENAYLIAVVFRTPITTCIERNSLREGRARVPESALKRMFYSMTDPAQDQLQKFDLVWYIDENGEVEQVKL